MEVTFADRVSAYHGFIGTLNDVVSRLRQAESDEPYPKQTVHSLTPEMLDSWLDSWESAYPGFRDQFERLVQITAKNRYEIETMQASLQRTKDFVAKISVMLWVAGAVFWIALAISRT